MAQFGTWFGAAPYLPYGIQLLPLTPISEDRDGLDWVNEVHYSTSTPFPQLAPIFTSVLNLVGRFFNSPSSNIIPAVPVVPHKKTIKESVSPFSLLDPVHDLHLASFDRPVESSPPKHMFVQREAEKSSGSSMAAHQAPLPTNAWYQNLLMLHGEPSNVHRAYSTPYLVDVVGPVPGLRANSNHILSSTSVLQLTFNEQFGLTLGAAPSFDETHGKALSSSDYDYKYHALETTELGLTLKWVSLFSTTPNCLYVICYPIRSSRMLLLTSVLLLFL
jgi:endoglucanase Acf2